MSVGRISKKEEGCTLKWNTKRMCFCNYIRQTSSVLVDDGVDPGKIQTVTVMG